MVKTIAKAIPLSATTNSVYRVFAGTGIQGRAGITGVTAQVGGPAVPLRVPGVDQIKIGPLPRTLTGCGEMNLFAVVDENRSNSVPVSIQ